MNHQRDTQEILAMFSYARPLGSATEQAFVDHYLTPLGFRRDPFQNLVLEVPERDGSRSHILFSSHVDTVDRSEGFKELAFDGDGMLGLSPQDRAKGYSCLGADDTAGVWLMVNMVRAGVPGVYVIHHGEESGCIGSGDLAARAPEFFDGIKAAIAFDRRGYADVVTHQCGFRTASDAFARSLCDQLGGAFSPCSGGVYTDTNEYIGIVSECTNVSVGYFSQHSSLETQDVDFLIDLRDRLLEVDWGALVFEREPDDGFGRGFDKWDDYFSPRSRDVSDLDTNTARLIALIEEYPDEVASLLIAYGIAAEDLAEHIEEETGFPVWGQVA